MTETNGPKPHGSQAALRRVLFIPGFDPNPPRRYRELYRAEAHAQAAVAGYQLSVRGVGATQFLTRFEEAETVFESRFEILGWGNLVAPLLARPRWSLALGLLRALGVYYGCGPMRSLLRLRTGPLFVSLYLLCCWLVWGLMWLAPVGLAFLMGGWLWGGAVGILALLAEAKTFPLAERWLYLAYLSADFAFWTRDLGAYPEGLSDRIAQWGGVLDAAMEATDDVLVVGHSSGAHLAMSLVADFARRHPERTPPQLLTLGQVSPMVSLLPKAQGLRSDLTCLAEARGLTWVDVTAPGDACCFALTDPVAIAGAGRADVPLILSAAFSRTLSDAQKARQSWRFFLRHRQYLCAFADPGPFDYFRATAGPAPLAQVFAHRSPSPKRLASLKPSRGAR